METQKIEPKYYRIEKCIQCGNEFKSTLCAVKRQFCEDCILSRKAYFDELVKEKLRISLKIMHEHALTKLECCDESFIFADIQESIDAIEEMEQISPESFLSASEILTAIGLFHEGFFFKINHMVGKYKVDFYMPDEKIVLEVDSGLHDIGNKRYKDGKKDVDLRHILGADWEVVRLNNSYTDKNPFHIGDKAVEIANRQRELRKKNRGMLPRGYSKSVDAYYAKVFD